MEEQKNYICHVCSKTFKDIVEFKVHKHNIGNNWLPMYQLYREQQIANAKLKERFGKNQGRRSLSDIGKTFFCFGKNNCIGDNYSYGEPAGRPDIIYRRADRGNDKGGANNGEKNHASGLGNRGDGNNPSGASASGGSTSGSNNAGGSRRL